MDWGEYRDRKGFYRWIGICREEKENSKTLLSWKIKFPKPVDIDRIATNNPSVDGTNIQREGGRNFILVNTKMGTIQIWKNYGRICYVDNSENMIPLKIFLYELVVKNQKKSMWDWLVEEFEKLKEDVEWNDFKEDIKRLRGKQ